LTVVEIHPHSDPRLDRTSPTRAPNRETIPMEVETAIRTRRTHKAFAPEPLPREQLEELLELANWAPNHHLTVPWRLRVVGPSSLDRLKLAAGPEGAAKLDRCPTLVVVSARLSGDPVQDEEDLHATAVASYIVLLAAHARGLAGYWRTPGFLRGEEGRAAAGLSPEERFVGLLHLGYPRQERPEPARPAGGETTVFLD
jgi:nitroreductase